MYVNRGVVILFKVEGPKLLNLLVCKTNSKSQEELFDNFFPLKWTVKHYKKNCLKIRFSILYLDIFNTMEYLYNYFNCHIFLYIHELYLFVLVSKDYLQCQQLNQKIHLHTCKEPNCQVLVTSYFEIQEFSITYCGLNRGHREGGPIAHSKNFKTPFFKRHWKILLRG